MIKLADILREVLEEKKADRCLRIARQKYDKPSAYRSGAIVRCRQGKIWKGLKEDETGGATEAKARAEDTLKARLSRTLSGTSENRLLRKVMNDVTTLEGEELRQYIRTNFLDRENSWKTRHLFADLLDAFDGKRK